jgi:membrane-associated phospholipid phosphatase
MISISAVWGRFVLWENQHRPFTRFFILTAGLVFFLVFLPSYLLIAFWNALQSNKILAVMLLVFSLLAVSLIWSAGQKLDAWTFLVFNVRGSRPHWLDRVMLGFTQIGSGITALGVAFIFFLAGNRLFSYQLILGTLTLWLLVELLKYIVHRSRPFIKMVQARIVGFPAIGSSFPSGHTSQVFFIATLVAQHFHLSIGLVILLYVIALLVGITRMYVGAHYPRDVLAGAILGSAWGLMGMVFDGFASNGLR